MSNTEGLKFTKVPIEGLTRLHVDEMWELYSTYYENVGRAQFDRDLAEKQSVFLGVERSTGRVRGFSTATFYLLSQGGRRVGVYYSGDTMVHPSYWGDRALHKALVPSLLAWRLKHPFRRLYWHLACNGYRTFLTLAHSFPEYWPHPERSLPDWERGLIDSISRRQFGDKWHPEAGVVRDVVCLKSQIAPFTPEVLAIPAVKFFLEQNPGYDRGDELSMIGRINLGFFFQTSLKVLRALRRRRPSPAKSARRHHHRPIGARASRPVASRSTAGLTTVQRGHG